MGSYAGPVSHSSLDQMDDTRLWTAGSFAYSEMPVTYGDRDLAGVYDVRTARYNEVEGRRTTQQIKVADALLAGLTVVSEQAGGGPFHDPAQGHPYPAFPIPHLPLEPPSQPQESSWAAPSNWPLAPPLVADPRLQATTLMNSSWSPATDYYTPPGHGITPESAAEISAQGAGSVWSSAASRASSVSASSRAAGYPNEYAPDVWAALREAEECGTGMGFIGPDELVHGNGGQEQANAHYWRGTTYSHAPLPTPPTPPSVLQPRAIHRGAEGVSIPEVTHPAFAYLPQPSATSSPYWATGSPQFPEWVPPQLENPAVGPPPYEQLFPFDDSLITNSRTRHLSSNSYLDPSTQGRVPQQHQQHQQVDKATYPEIIDFTASNGVLAGSLQASPSPRIPQGRRRTVTISGNSASDDGPRVPKTKVKRIVMETDMGCTKCGTPIARLLLRGTADELAVPHTAVYSCTACAPSAFVHSASNSPSTSDSIASDGNGSAGSSRAPAKVNRPAAPFRKRSRRVDDPSSLLTCDVCLRDVASGGIVANDSQSSADFAIEAICCRCAERYRRCSDCGGGGGNRIAVGKWRSKELFAAGRKTCELSHLRLGSLTDTYFDVWAAKDLPRSELDLVVGNCKRIFTNTMMAAICIPEVLETQTAMATSYDDCKLMGERGWTSMEPMIRDDIEDSRQIRRYLAMRFCTPHPRKTKNKVVNAPVPVHDPTQVMRAGKDLMGFIIAEHDLVNGTMFLAVVAPWAMADMNDPAAVLIQALLRRADAERIATNVKRARQGLLAYPPMIHVWTMLFFKRDSRMMNHMERTRGFSPLDEYMDAYSDVNEFAFPPHRPCYIPIERMGGWQVLVRSQTGDGKDDWHPRRAMSDRAKKAAAAAAAQMIKDRERG